ncbi:hypothetical protein MUG84_14620 [Paenibacillus sp. KQZ6P-2]|uniref:Uncharacterized protein n=1 Tax=Paenibacillus mangrovi TaxID=2931978 RepID=A0A9X1WQ08_9BACL|nr:hypothetical protein [Paenibacillus mangrovi]MCJ8012969.1 hypothetical protein [Paenibacillus mangrovi]
MKNQVLKWVILFCIATLVFNGLLYWGTGKSEVLINLYGAAGLGILSAFGLLFTRNKR